VAGENGVHLFGYQIHPRRVAQVGVHNAHAVVTGEGRRRDCEQDGIDIDTDRARRGEPIEQPAGDRSSPTREVDHVWCSARDRVKDVQ
jgi:hypothetical protein